MFSSFTTELFCALRLTNQVDPDAGPDQVTHVDVYWVTAVLGYLGQAGAASRHAEREHQQRFQQLGCAADAGIEVHLWKESDTARQTETAVGDLNTSCQRFYFNGRHI